MPIYEYRCPDCEHAFEALVRGETEPSSCPECGATEVERLLSLPGVRTRATRGKAMKAAKARDRTQGAERARERIEYEANHD